MGGEKITSIVELRAGPKHNGNIYQCFAHNPTFFDDQSMQGEPNATIRLEVLCKFPGFDLPHFVSFHTYLLSVPADKQVEYTQSTHLTLKHNEIMNWKINFSSSIIKKSATFLM